MRIDTTVGTWAWAQRTHGRLRRRDRAQLLGQAVLTRLSALPRPWQDQLLGGRSSLTMPTPPDSGVARLAEERVREVSSPVMHAHCLRTWCFAALIAQRDGLQHDEELLYLACVLHDLGLTEAHDRRDATAACFAVEGARAAHDLLCHHGLAEDRARTVASAISLHLNIRVPTRLGAEAHLLSAGAAFDVVGRGVRKLPSATTAEVVARWPRRDCAAELATMTGAQANVRPDSRAALLHRLGFAQLIAANPLDRVRVSNLPA